MTADDFPQHLEDSSIRDLEARLSSLRQRLAVLTDEHGPMWPEVRQTELEISELEQQLRRDKNLALTGARES